MRAFAAGVLSLPTLLGLLGLFGGSLSACKSDPPLDVAQVDLQRFQGKWYEVAKLPRPTQAGCENTTASYHLKSSTELDVVNQCQRDGATTTVTAKAIVTDKDAPAKLALDVGAFFGDYWILEVGEAGVDYDYAVIGHPTRDYLWILSRTPTLPKETLDGIVARAADREFDVSRLEYTKQDGVSQADEADVPDAPPPREYGCALAEHAPRSPSDAVLAAGVGMIAAYWTLRRARRHH